MKKKLSIISLVIVLATALIGGAVFAGQFEGMVTDVKKAEGEFTLNEVKEEGGKKVKVDSGKTVTLKASKKFIAKSGVLPQRVMDCKYKDDTMEAEECVKTQSAPGC